MSEIFKITTPETGRELWLTYSNPYFLGVLFQIDVDAECGDAADDTRVKEEHVNDPDDTDWAANQIRDKLVIGLGFEDVKHLLLVGGVRMDNVVDWIGIHFVLFELMWI